MEETPVLDKLIQILSGDKRNRDYVQFSENMYNAILGLLRVKFQRRAERFKRDAKSVRISAPSLSWEDLTEEEQWKLNRIGMTRQYFEDENMPGGVQAQMRYFVHRLAFPDGEDTSDRCLQTNMLQDLITEDYLFLSTSPESARLLEVLTPPTDLPIAYITKIAVLVWASRNSAGTDKPSKSYEGLVRATQFNAQFHRDVQTEMVEDTSDDNQNAPMTRDEKRALFFWKTRLFRRTEDFQLLNEIIERPSDPSINISTIAVWETMHDIVELERNPETIHNRLSRLLREFNRMKKLIGMNELKEELAKIVVAFSVEGAVFAENYLHLVFQGPPGSGKSLFADTIGLVFYAAGIIMTPRTRKVNREDLIPGYEGQSATLTRRVMVKYGYEGVIFLDEADTLARPGNEDRSGQEAVATIFRFSTDYIGEAVIIVAGYKESLDNSFFAVNRGLIRRFDKYRFDFRGYNTMEIAEMMMMKMAKVIVQNNINAEPTEDAYVRIAQWLAENRPMSVPPGTSLREKREAEYRLFGAHGADAEKFVLGLVENIIVRNFLSGNYTDYIIDADDVDVAGNERKKQKDRSFTAYLDSSNLSDARRTRVTVPSTSKRYDQDIVDLLERVFETTWKNYTEERGKEDEAGITCVPGNETPLPSEYGSPAGPSPVRSSAGRRPPPRTGNRRSTRTRNVSEEPSESSDSSEMAEFDEMTPTQRRAARAAETRRLRREQERAKEIERKDEEEKTELKKQLRTVLGLGRRGSLGELEDASVKVLRQRLDEIQDNERTRVSERLLRRLSIK